MKGLLFSFLLLAATIVSAQEENNGSHISTPVTEPQALEISMFGDIAFKDGFEKVTDITENYFHKSSMCEGSDLAIRTKPDSFAVTWLPFTYIGSVVKLKPDKYTTVYVVYGEFSCYGSGMGSTNDGFAIITLQGQPMLLFRMFYSCAQEVFARYGVTEQEADEGTFGLERNVTVLGRKIIIRDNPAVLAAMKNKAELCEMTDIKAGIFEYRNGRYTRTE